MSITSFEFTPATKDQAKARIALAGVSGSGKTFTALVIASAFGGPIALLDTERGSASKYAAPKSRRGNPRPGEFVFDTKIMTRYDPRDLPRALAAAEAAGYENVIIDSLSRFWQGAGGMLEFVDNVAKRANSPFGGWKEARPVEQDMIEAMLAYPGHVIVTMRVKTAYEILEDDRGRKVPTKIGLQPVQRDGIEYEFDIVGDMDLENTLTVSKSRCSEVAGAVVRRPDASFAKTILDWLSDGEPVLSAKDYREQALRPGATFAELQALWYTVRDAGLKGSMTTDPDDGNPIALGQLIFARGKTAEAAEVFQREASGNGQAAPAEAAEAGQEPDAPASEPASEPASSPPAGGPEDDGPSEWAQKFLADLAAAGDEAKVTALGREVPKAMRAKKIDPAEANKLLNEVAARKAQFKGEK